MTRSFSDRLSGTIEMVKEIGSAMLKGAEAADKPPETGPKTAMVSPCPACLADGARCTRPAAHEGPCVFDDGGAP